MTEPSHTIDQSAYYEPRLNLTLVQQYLQQDGYAYIRSLPVGFDHVDEVSRLGVPIPQFDGVVVCDIRPEPTVSEAIYSASNTRELLPHTEWFEFPGDPPHYVALWCVRQAAGPGGETTLADAYDFVGQYGSREYNRLLSTTYGWGPSVALRHLGISFSTEHSLLELIGGRLVVRFPCDDTNSKFDEVASDFIARGRHYFREHEIAIRIEENALLIWDNWRMLHARNAFDDRLRHMRRVLIAGQK